MPNHTLTDGDFKMVLVLLRQKAYDLTRGAADLDVQRSALQQRVHRFLRAHKDVALTSSAPTTTVSATAFANTNPANTITATASPANPTATRTREKLTPKSKAPAPSKAMTSKTKKRRIEEVEEGDEDLEDYDLEDDDLKDEGTEDEVSDAKEEADNVYA